MDACGSCDWSIAHLVGCLPSMNLGKLRSPKSLNTTLFAACTSSATTAYPQQIHLVTRASPPPIVTSLPTALRSGLQQNNSPEPNMSQPIGNRQQAQTAPYVFTATYKLSPQRGLN